MAVRPFERQDQAESLVTTFPRASWLSISQNIFVKSLSLSRKATLRDHFWAVIRKFMISSLCAPWCFEGLLPETTRAYFGPQPIHPSGTLSIVHGRHKTLLGLAALQCSVRILTNSGSHSLTPGPGPAINPKPPHPCPADRVKVRSHMLPYKDSFQKEPRPKII